MATASLCATCAALKLTREDFTKDTVGRWDTETWRPVLSGSKSELEKKCDTCGLCQLLLRTLNANIYDVSDQTVDFEWEAAWILNDLDYRETDVLQCSKGSGLCPVKKSWLAAPVNLIQLVEDEETTIAEPLYGRRRSLDVDIGRISGWFQFCCREHADNCSATFLKASRQPISTFMIDVIDKCIRPTDTGVEYIALSYVWGRNNEPQTRQRVVKEFSEVGAFDRVTLPCTIKDAIAVTTALGFRYLWVDSLCIVQDQLEEKIKLINAMDLIYNQAALTIIAATGDTAHAGLSGWSRQSREEIPELIAVIAPDLKVGVLPQCGLLLETCDWVQRGWTCQEGILSNRCLIFLEGQIYFMCRQHLWREDLVGALPTANFSGSPFLGRPEEGYDPTPQQIFQELVGYYSPRILTFPSDIGPAFQGIENAIGPAIGGTQFFFGLTSCAFDASILWTRKSHNKEITRRPGVPSWSWMGWEGHTNYLNTSFAPDEMDWLTKRTWIDWYTVMNSELICVWDSVRDTIVDNRKAEGHEGLQGSQLDAARYGPSSIENPFGRQTVVWPLPSSRPPSLDASTVPLDFSYLAFVTVYTVLNVRVYTIHNQITKTHIDICDREGSVCGTVQDYYLPDLPSSGGGMKPMEVILISYADCGLSSFFATGEAYKTCGQIELAPLPTIGFNVLIIAPHPKNPGIYERIGFGFLLKDALLRGREFPVWRQIVLG